MGEWGDVEPGFAIPEGESSLEFSSGELEARPERPKIEEGDDETDKMPEATARRFTEKGFEVFALGGESVSEIADAIAKTGLDIDWSKMSPADRERLLAERLPHSQVALKRGTSGHPQIWDLLLPADAQAKLGELSSATSPNNPGTRGIMGTFGLHMGILGKQLEGWKIDSPLNDPIYAPQPYFSSPNVRIRTSTLDSEGRSVLVVLRHDEEEPGVGVQSVSVEPETIESLPVRTYLPFVPTATADRIEPPIAPRMDPSLRN